MPSDESVATAVRVWPSARRGREVTADEDYGPPAPPVWAAHSVVEDSAVTHELVSDVHPVVEQPSPVVESSSNAFPADVSVSVVDRPTGRGWSRTPPTVQVEGGTYSLKDGLLLARAIEELVTLMSRM
jgi:hypothetical protein